MKIFLLGKHSNRTPMAYKDYKLLFESRGVKYVESMQQADYIILGFSIDIKAEFEKLRSVILENPSVKIVVISEEPLWDTVWTKDYKSQSSSFSLNGDRVEYYQLNHFNSNIFDFLNFPYFVTTEAKYLVRYSNFFARNTRISRPELIEKFANKRYLFSSIAEKRVDEEVNKYEGKQVVGLSKFRTLLAESVTCRKLCIGKGWTNRPPRQQEFDWHLSKLSEFDDSSLVMSSLENTINENYITEKIFDAYATLSFPLYYADDKHGIHRIIKNDSPIYLSTDNLRTAVGFVDCYKDNWRNKIDAYIEDMNDLHSLFSNFESYRFEREGVVDRVLNNINQLV
jgi:hypothetical protein